MLLIGGVDLGHSWLGLDWQYIRSYPVNALVPLQYPCQQYRLADPLHK